MQNSMDNAQRAARLALMSFAAILAPTQPGVAGAPSADAGTDWQAFGRTHSEQRYSPLDQIDRRNVGRLGIDWALDIPDAIAFTSTPLAVDGVLYMSGDRAIVRAVDARTGQLLWTYDPQVWRHAPRGMVTGWNVNRGIAYAAGLVYVGTADGRLVALSAKTGELAWTARHFLAESRKAITGPPRVAGGKVFIGHGGAEFGTRGYVDAFDAKTGAHLWRFHTVPGDPSDGFENPAMEMAAKTWHGQWWKYGGGGTVWHAITYDPELNRVYLGVGNGDPWDYVKRSKGKGDNLFLCSIVALDADTGQYVWHYQMNPGEEWDYKATADIVLADLTIKGKTHKALMQAPTNGFFYVIDRDSGKLLSAEKYDKVTWAERIDMTTGRPVEAAGMRPRGTDKVTFYPGPWGAHTWHSMSYSPRTKLVYIPTMRIAGTLGQLPPYPFREKFFTIGKLIEHPTDPKDSSGSLLAWDPVRQRERWRVNYQAVWNGGTLATGGDLVFHGTADGDFRAFDARSGKSLWTMNMQRGISSAPISYSIDGQQRIALLVGWGGLMAVNNAAFQKHGWKYKGPGIRLVSFSLTGKAVLPAVPETRFALAPADVGAAPIDAALAEQGFGVYHGSSCAVCHGAEVKSNGASAPDLRESTLAMNFDSFKTVVADGALLANGMPMFNDLSDQELRAVHEYVRQQTRLAVPRTAGR